MIEKESAREPRKVASVKVVKAETTGKEKVKDNEITEPPEQQRTGGFGEQRSEQSWNAEVKHWDLADDD